MALELIDLYDHVDEEGPSTWTVLFRAGERRMIVAVSDRDILYAAAAGKLTAFHVDALQKGILDAVQCDSAEILALARRSLRQRSAVNE